MNLGFVLLGGAAMLAVLVTWVNERHDRARKALSPSADDQVDAAWAEFGVGDDPEAVRASLDALLDAVDPATLTRKNAVVALAVMAARCERFDVLPTLASKARTLDGGCGETAALGVLAEACGGDARRAREMFLASQSAMAGCASCGAAGPGKYLMQEVAIMLDAMDVPPVA